MAVGKTYRNALLFSFHCLYQSIDHIVELINIDRLITCYRCICIAAAAVASYAVGNAAVVVLVVSR